MLKFFCNFIYPVLRDGALSTHINNDYDHFSRYNSYYHNDKLGGIGEKILLQRYGYLKYPKFKISDKQDL